MGVMALLKNQVRFQLVGSMIKSPRHTVSGCNCCFIKQALPMEIRGETALLGNDEKIKSDLILSDA